MSDTVTEGEPLDVMGRVFENILVVEVEIEGITFSARIPGNRMGNLVTAVTYFPAAFEAILEGAAEREKVADDA